MRVHTLKLTNFRCFEGIELSFDSHFNVLIGENGAGKTAVLNAISIAMRMAVPSSFEPRYESETRLMTSDVRARFFDREGTFLTREEQFPTEIRLVGSVFGEEWLARVQRVDRSKGAAAGDGTLRDKLSDRGSRARGGSDAPLPLFVAYPTSRLSRVVRGKINRGSAPESRFDGYHDCWRSGASERFLAEWLQRHTYIRLAKQGAYEVPDAIERAVRACFPGCTRFGFDVVSARVLVEFGEGATRTSVPFAALSDGQRALAGFAADLAWRTITLNPHWGVEAPRQTEGVVLIDEIDLHLHPKWQRGIVQGLKNAFPKLQFIATTHSPFIVQSLQPHELLSLGGNVLDEGTDWTKKSIEDVTEQAMGVEVPQRSERHRKMIEVASRYYDAIERAGRASNEEIEVLRRELDELAAIFDGDPAVIALLSSERQAAGLGPQSGAKPEAEVPR